MGVKEIRELEDAVREIVVKDSGVKKGAWEEGGFDIEEEDEEEDDVDFSVEDNMLGSGEDLEGVLESEEVEDFGDVDFVRESVNYDANVGSFGGMYGGSVSSGSYGVSSGGRDFYEGAGGSSGMSSYAAVGGSSPMSGYSVGGESKGESKLYSVSAVQSGGKIGAGYAVIGSKKNADRVGRVSNLEKGARRPTKRQNKGNRML